MKTIKVCVYKKDYPTFVERNELESSFQNNHLLISNLTKEQKDKVLELLGTFGEIVTEIKTKDYERHENFCQIKGGQ